jgi:hypothetical protein
VALPLYASPQIEEFLRRYENAQRKRLTHIVGLIPSDCLNALRLQAPSYEIGNLMHEEIAFGAAEHANPDPLSLKECGKLGSLGTCKRAVRQCSEPSTLSFKYRIHLCQQLGNHFTACELTRLVQSVLKEVVPGVQASIAEVAVQ